MKEAFHIATTGRPGPVLIDVPKDVSSAPCNAPFVDAKDLDLPGYRVPGRGDAELIARAAELLRAAKRPILYVGHGAVISGAGKAVMALAEKLRAPIVNTLLGKGAADETHALHLGMLGMHGTAYANKAVADCDLIMSIGARWDDRVTSKVDAFCPQAVKIHIDVDAVGVQQDAAPRRLHRGRRAARARGPAAARRGGRHRGVAAPVQRLAAPVPAPLPEAGRPPRAARARPAERPHPGRAPSSPPTSASTRCGRRSSAAPRRTATGSRRAAPARWASASRRRSAPSSGGPTRRSGRWSATAASR